MPAAGPKHCHAANGSPILQPLQPLRPLLPFSAHPREHLPSPWGEAPRQGPGP